MLTVIKYLKSLVKMFLNFLFVVQITLMMLVFLTATYWFCDLIGSSLFSFAQPIANLIMDFVKLFYKQDILIGGMYVDGSLLLFDVIAILVVFLITKLKYYVYSLINLLDDAFEKYKQLEEDDFNKKLKEDIDAKIYKMNNVAILIELDVKDMFMDKRYCGSDIKVRDVEPYKQQAYKILFETLKSLKVCQFARLKGKMLVTSGDFSKIDNMIYFIEQALVRIKKNLNNEKFSLDYYISADVYDNETDFKSKICPLLEKLIHLKNKNLVTCFGNFNLRYALKTKPMYYTVLLKGAYMIDGGADIYVLLKRN